MKRVLVAVTVMASVIAMTACSSSATRTQSLSPTAPSSTPGTILSTAPSQSTTSSASPSGSTTSIPTSTKSIPTPTVTPPAQSAVGSYIAFVNLSVVAAADPVHADLNAFSKYVTGTALTEIKSGFKEMAKDGYAYRGTPPKPRLKVTVSESSVVVLSDCGLDSTSDPYVEYNVKTGKVIPQRTQSPAPPYLHVITMHLVSGSWKLASIDVNSSKTCTP